MTMRLTNGDRPARPRDRADIGGAVRSGARITFLSQALTQLGSVLATVVLARLLTPAEFGLIAITQSIMGAGALLSVAGLTASLVTRRGDVELIAATYFWMALGVGLAMTGVIAFSAAGLTSMAGLPEARWYLTVLAAGFPFTLASLVPQALLQRQMAFSRLGAATLIPACLYFGSEVTLALLGWGAWAVILGQVIGAAMSMVLGLILARWLPRREISYRELRRDLGLVSGITLDQAFTYVHKNVDYWGVGRVLGANALGAYYVAYVLPNIIRQRLSSVFRVVMLPALSSGATDTETKRKHWQRAASLMVFMGFPSLTGIALLAEPLTGLLFGGQWAAAVVPMQILIVGAMLDLIVQAVGTMAIAQRRIRTHTTVIGLRLLATATGVVVALLVFETAAAVASAVLIAGAVTLVIQEFAVSRPLGIGIRPLAKVLASVVPASVGMTIGVLCLTRWSPTWPLLVQVLAGSAVGASIYMGTALALNREYTMDMLRQCRRVILQARAKEAT